MFPALFDILESMKDEDVLEIAVDLGVEMLRAGAEIYRVEDTVSYVLAAYHVPSYHIYVLSNGIFAGVPHHSVVRHVSFGDVNLEKISLLNQLARDISAGQYGLREVRIRLEECKRRKEVPTLVRSLCCGTGSAAFCYLFGGVWQDMVGTFLIGFLLEILSYLTGKSKAARFIHRFFFACAVTGLSELFQRIGMTVQQDKVVIAGILSLLPGVTFTTSIRDFCNGDYLSGVIHMVDALLIGFAVAAGVGFTLHLL